MIQYLLSGRFLWLPIVLGGLAISPAQGAMKQFVATRNDPSNSGQSLAAEVNFEVINGNQLKITLSNTYDKSYDAEGGKTVPADILNAVFFDINGRPALSYLSANVAPGSTFVNKPGADGTNVKAPPVEGGWVYKANSTGTLNGVSQSYGFGSAGLNIFWGYWTNPVPDYGLVNKGYIAGTGNSAIQNAPLIRSSVVFVLSGLSTNFDLNSISNVRFQYGTGLSEPSMDGVPGVMVQGQSVVPEPGSLALAGFAGIGLALRAWRRRTPSSKLAA